MKGGAVFRFRLYTAGFSQNSAMAHANLKKYCQLFIPEQYSIEIVDVLEDPQRALEDGILVTPTLVRLAPEPIFRIIGNLNDSEWIISALGDNRGNR